MSFIIVTDSCCDLPSDLIVERGIKIIPLYTIIDGIETPDNGTAAPDVCRKHYDMIREGKLISTSCANAEVAKDILSEALKTSDVLYMGFSSALSLTYKAVSDACEQLAPLYPERKIMHLDTLNASLGQGLMVSYACDMRDSGASITEVYDYFQANKLSFQSLFTVDALKYLYAGGRVSKKTQFFADILNIKPLMTVDEQGRLVVTGKVFGRKLALTAIADRVVKTAANPEESTLFIGHGDCIGDVHYFLSLLEDRITFKHTVINYIGMVVGAHSGPGTLAVFCKKL